MSLIHEVKDIFSIRNGVTSLHKSWETVEIKDVVKIQNGYAFKSANFNNEGQGFPLLRIRDILNGTTKTYFDGDYPEEYVVEKEDLLIGMDGDFNSDLWKGEKILLNQRVCRLFPNEKYLLKKFLAYGIGGYLEKINENTSSTTVKHLSSKSIGQIPFPLPPLQEQKRIVAKLDTLFASLENTKARLEKIPILIKNFKQAILTQAVTGKLTEQWREGKELESGDLLYLQIEKYKNDLISRKLLKKQKAVEIVDSNAWQIPNSWKLCRLGECINLISGQDLKPNQYSDINNEGIPYITGASHLKNEKVIISRWTQEPRSFAYKGDLLLTCKGSGVGKMGWLEEEKVHIARQIMAINSFIIPNKYVKITLSENVVRIKENSKGLIPGIDRESVRNFLFPLPPLKEQTEIVRRVESLFAKADAIEQRYNKLKQKVDTLPQAILAKAFRGELVEQNPLDEPASVLLEKIQSLRQAQGSAKSKKKVVRKKKSVN